MKQLTIWPWVCECGGVKELPLAKAKDFTFFVCYKCMRLWDKDNLLSEITLKKSRKGGDKYGIFYKGNS